MKHSTCPAEPASPDHTDALIHTFDFHDIARVLTGAVTLFASLICFFFIFQHAKNYSKPHEQRQVIRILFIVPIYAVTSFWSVLSYDAAQYIKPLADVYEGYALASFLVLMISFVLRSHAFSDELDASWRIGGRLLTGRDLPPKIHLIWICVFQYCVSKVLITILAELTLAAGRYCETSNSPAFAHVWVQVLQTITVIICVTGLLGFYNAMKAEMQAQNPLKKFLAIKVLILINTVQNMLFSMLVSSKKLKPSSKLSYQDVSIGIPTMLFSVELIFFAILFAVAYPVKPYKEAAVGEDGLKAEPRGSFFDNLVHAFNFIDIFHGIAWAVQLVKGSNTPHQAKRVDSPDELDAINLSAPPMYEEPGPGAEYAGGYPSGQQPHAPGQYAAPTHFGADTGYYPPGRY